MTAWVKVPESPCLYLLSILNPLLVTQGMLNIWSWEFCQALCDFFAYYRVCEIRGKKEKVCGLIGREALLCNIERYPPLLSHHPEFVTSISLSRMRMISRKAGQEWRPKYGPIKCPLSDNLFNKHLGEDWWWLGSRRMTLINTIMTVASIYWPPTIFQAFSGVLCLPVHPSILPPTQFLLSAY